jgi:glycosyltransferase involved in cell wall biosynthesis
MYSVLILTLNEEKNLPGCLAGLPACDDVVVLDSHSTDRTAEIARASGARVFTHAFRDFADQRNHAHAGIPFRHDWVFHLDADEQLTPALHEECRRLLQSGRLADIDGCLVAPRMMFRGRWIRRCTDFPAYQARFVHVRRFRFIEHGHGQREAPGLRLLRLEANYLHNLSAQSEDEMEAKHRRYAVAEAKGFLDHLRPLSLVTRDLLSRDPLIRSRSLKELSQRLPFRGLLRFVYQFVLRGGFMDGAPGLAYCRMLARYEAAVAREIRNLSQRAPSSL